MTIKEMFSKVNEYNRIQDLLHLDFADKVNVFYVDDTICRSFDSYEACEDFIRETYIEGCARKILNHNGYDFRKPVTFDVDLFGTKNVFTIEFQAA